MTDPNEPQPYALTDPTVQRLAKFLSKTPLSNGHLAPILDPMNGLLAQAICNYTQGLVWDVDADGWVSLGEWQADPEFGDVLIETVTEEGVTRMTHRVTGMSALGESPDDAWRQLRTKVRSAAHG